jgi:microcystin-dependent protein
MSILPLQPEDNGAVSRTKINDNFIEVENAIEAVINDGAPLATTTVKGRVKLSVAPADADEPTAVGDNDPRLAFPAGIIHQYAGTTAPTGFLLCDGTAVSRVTYAALFSVVSTMYGEGNGVSTFNLPDLRGRIAVGRDSSQTEFDTLGETGGAKTHTLTGAQIPVHDHGLGGRSIATATSGSGGYSGGSSRSNVTATSFGGGEAHNNLQPYITLNYIIKT